MRGQLYINRDHISLVLYSNNQPYIVQSYHLTFGYRNMFGNNQTDIEKQFCIRSAKDLGNVVQGNLNQTETIIPLNEEETKQIVLQLVDWIRTTESIFFMPHLVNQINRAYQDMRNAYNLQLALRFNPKTHQFCILTFNQKYKEFKPRNVRIGYILDRLQLADKEKREILAEWEQFLEELHGIHIEVLDSTRANWRKIYHPEITPVKSCMTYRHLFTKVADFYMALPAKPIVIRRGNTPIGRTILWEDKYYDRIYSSLGYNFANIIACFERQGYQCVSSEKLVYPFDPKPIFARRFVPYLDNLHWLGALNKNEALLSNNAELLIEILRAHGSDKPTRIAAICVPSHKERYEDAMSVLSQI